MTPVPEAPRSASPRGEGRERDTKRLMQVLLRIGSVALPLFLAPLVYGFVMFGLAFPEHLRGAELTHATINACANVLVALWALRLIGRLDIKIAGVLARVILVHGGLAFLVLTLRLPYSNQVMLAAAAVSLLLGLAFMFLNHLISRKRVALIGLEHEIPTIRGIAWDRITDPRADLRPYHTLLTGSLTDMTPDWVAVVSRAMVSGKMVRHFADYMEEQQGLTSIEHFDLDHLPVAGLTSYGTQKRVMDLMLAVLVAPIALPILAFGAAAVLVSMGRPIFFVQSRTGIGGRVFNIYKLRTMRPKLDEPGSPASSGEKRITRTGMWLRRFRIDELPQLFNVLKGDMSIVGPRPEWTDLSDVYAQEISAYAYRHLVRPGITGWAQNMSGYASNVEETKVKLGYDLFYVKNISLGLDLQILLRTVWTVISGAGAR